MRISLKKNHLVNSKRSDSKMAEYLSQVGTMPAEFMVFAGETPLFDVFKMMLSSLIHGQPDESSICQRSLIRTRGRAPHAQRSHHQTNHSNAKRYSLLPGISLYGVLGLDIKEGSFKRPDFESFLKHTLLPRMNPFPGVNSVLIVDNCTIHKGGNIQELCDRYGGFILESFFCLDILILKPNVKQVYG